MWWTIVCLAALLTVMVAAPVAADDNGKRAGGEGKYAQWTAEWWQWLFSLPVGENPAFDETGAKAGNAQPNPKAFYLVGVFNESNTASRKITIPQNTPLFGPVINFQNDNVYNAEPLTVPQLRASRPNTSTPPPTPWNLTVSRSQSRRPHQISGVRLCFAGERQHLPVLRDGRHRAHQALRVGWLLVLHPAARAGNAHAAVYRQLPDLRPSFLALIEYEITVK